MKNAAKNDKPRNISKVPNHQKQRISTRIEKFKKYCRCKIQILHINRVSSSWIAYSSQESHSHIRFANEQSKAREGNGPVDLVFFEVDRKKELLVKNFSSSVLRSLRARSFLVLRLPSLRHVLFSPETFGRRATFLYSNRRRVGSSKLQKTPLCFKN